MKKLNNKGFTLIELLAVIVILAIVMGISANAVLTSINNSRRSSLYSAAQNAANTLNNWATEDAMVSESNGKMLGDKFVKALNDSTWKCLNSGDVANIQNRASTTNPSTNLLTALGINIKDIEIGSTPPTFNTTSKKYTNIASACSAIRYNSSTGGYELFLRAKSGGKFYVTTDADHFAFSRASGTNEQIAD